MTDEELLKDVPDFIKDCPVVYHWVDYRGKRKFAMLNYEESLKYNKPMIDLCYCATLAMNGVVEKTVPYRKENFVLAP